MSVSFKGQVTACFANKDDAEKAEFFLKKQFGHQQQFDNLDSLDINLINQQNPLFLVGQTKTETFLQIKRQQTDQCLSLLKLKNLILSFQVRNRLTKKRLIVIVFINLDNELTQVTLTDNYQITQIVNLEKVFKEELQQENYGKALLKHRIEVMSHIQQHKLGYSQFELLVRYRDFVHRVELQFNHQNQVTLAFIDQPANFLPSKFMMYILSQIGAKDINKHLELTKRELQFEFDFEEELEQKLYDKELKKKEDEEKKKNNQEGAEEGQQQEEEKDQETKDREAAEQQQKLEAEAKAKADA